MKSVSTLMAVAIVSAAVSGRGQAKPPENESDGPKIIARASGVNHDKSADKAFDGDPNTWWDAGDNPPQWIEANLGRRYVLKSISLTVAQTEPWETAHEVWISDKPIAGHRTGARLLLSFRGMTQSGQGLRFDFPAGIVAQYVEVRTVESRGWTAWKEIDIRTVEEPAAAVDVTKGLIAHYGFDEDFKDRSGRGNHGTPHGGPRWVRGVIGAAAQFDGKDDFIELGSSDAYSTHGQISACAWIFRKDRAIIVLSNYRGGAAYRGQFMFEIDGAGVLDVAFGQGPGQYLRYRAAEADLVPAGEWRHVAFSYDERRGEGHKIRLYADGKKLDKHAIQGEGTGAPVLQTSDRLRIMHRDQRPGCFSRGMVDEVRIYNRALTSEEVRRLYQARP